jgi:hypothetical protein
MGDVITDAIKFVQKNSKEKLLLNQSTTISPQRKNEDDDNNSKESKEPDYNDDAKDISLEEEETGEISESEAKTTTN